MHAAFCIAACELAWHPMLTWHIHNGGMKSEDLFAECYIAWIKGIRAGKEAMQNLTHLPINQFMVEKIFIYWYWDTISKRSNKNKWWQDCCIPRKVCVDTVTYRNEQICFQHLLFQVIRWGETGLLLAKHLSSLQKQYTTFMKCNWSDTPSRKYILPTLVSQ